MKSGFPSLEFSRLCLTIEAIIITLSNVVLNYIEEILKILHRKGQRGVKGGTPFN